jgi:hypothetical protein
MKLLFVLSSLALATALDVEINSVDCDSSLPVTADIILDCNGSSRCTLGGEAMIYGTSKLTRERYIITTTMPNGNRFSLCVLPLPLSSVLQWSRGFRCGG